MVSKLDKRTITACFTGHREIRESVSVLFEKVCDMTEGMIHKGYRYFLTGGARGFDALAAKAVLHLQEKYTDIHLILVLPFQNQYERERGWSAEEVEEYHFLKNSASKVLHLQTAYSSGCYYRRDRYLVEHSSVCMAYQYKSTGGTAYTTNYARQSGINVLNM